MSMSNEITDSKKKSAEKQIILKDSFWKYYEWFFFATAFLVYLEAIKRNTMFSFQVPAVYFLLESLCVTGILVIQLFAVIFSLTGSAEGHFLWRKEEIIIAIPAVIILELCSFLVGYEEMNYVAILLLGAHNIKADKFWKCFCISTAVIIVVTMLCGLTGVIENLVYRIGENKETVRISFGFIYPTDFCAHLFYLIVGFVFWKKEKALHIGWLIAIAAITVFTFLACHARTTTMCLGALLVWMVFCKIINSVKKGNEWSTPAVIDWGCIGSIPFCAVVMFVLSAIYDESNAILLKLDSVLNHRLMLGKEGFLKYPITLLGQKIEMVGAGGTTDERLNYFFLDCSYVNILMQYGVLVLIVILGLYVFQAWKDKKNRNTVCIFVWVVIGLHCIMEHRMLDLAFCPLMYTAFLMREQKDIE